MNLKEFLQQSLNFDMYTFGKFICQRREELGFSQRELASRLGVSHVYLFHVEKGKKSPSAKLIQQLNNILRIDYNGVDEHEFEDLINLTKGECSPDLIHYMIASKEARAAIRYVMKHNISGEELLDALQTIKEKEE